MAVARLLERLGGLSGGPSPPADSQAALPELPGITLKGPASAPRAGRACGSVECSPLAAASTQTDYLTARLARLLPSRLRASRR